MYGPEIGPSKNDGMFWSGNYVSALEVLQYRVVTNYYFQLAVRLFTGWFFILIKSNRMRITQP